MGSFFPYEGQDVKCKGKWEISSHMDSPPMKMALIDRRELCWYLLRSHIEIINL